MIDKETIEEFFDFIESMEAPDYSEDQKKAIAGQVPMTQEIFNGCVMRCTKDGNIRELFDLFERFPACGKVFCEGLERDLILIDAHMEEKRFSLPPETIQSRWDIFRDTVRIIYGDEEVDKLPIEAPAKY